MDHQACSENVVKIIYEKKGILIDLKGTNFNHLLNKLNRAYGLRPNGYYHLYYIDSDGDNITISSSQDFQTFLTIPCKKKLYLQKTNESFLHFNKQYQEKLIIFPVKNKGSISQIIQQKRQQLMKRLQNRLPKIQAIVREEMKQKLKEFQQKRKYNGIDFTICHQGIKCDKCKTGRDIQGIRYECVECHYNICVYCEQHDDHNHLLIKIYNPSQTIAIKKNEINYLNRKEKSSSKPALEMEKMKSSKIFQQFLYITSATQQKAVKHIKKYSNKNIQELVDLYFEQNDN